MSATSILWKHPGLDRPKNCLITGFVLSAGIVLVVTGVAKIWSGLGNSKLLAITDPVIGLTFGQLMFAVGTVEIVIALVCFFTKRQTLALGLVAWLSTNFVVYRVGLWWIGWQKPCSCLGNLTDALHISPQVADNIIKAVLACLLIGSYGLLFWWRQRGRGLQHGLRNPTAECEA